MIIMQKWITRDDLRANPAVLYIFGDNEIRSGLGGQAKEMRGEPNAAGIATLYAPGRYWTEANITHQCSVIDADMAPVFEAAKSGHLIVFPLDGIGTGLACLKSHSPTTFAHLEQRVAALKSFGGN